jgi:hypothetical protein
MGTKIPRRSRAVLGSRFALAIAVAGLALSLVALHASEPCPHSAGSLCAERAPLLVSAALSCWSALASLGLGATGAALPARSAHRTATCWDATTALLLLRSLLSGGVVALLGWRALVGEASHLAVMAAMQANSTVGAWLACERHRHCARVRTPSPLPTSDELTPLTLAPQRRTSATLPRGWRYHRSTGLFEHKRTGRMQYEPPGSRAACSPLCNDLPPCDEEHALLEYGSDRGSDRDSGCEGDRRAWRSRTWDDGSRKGRQRPDPHHSSPMTLWELRAALGELPQHGLSRGAHVRTAAGREARDGFAQGDAV